MPKNPFKQQQGYDPRPNRNNFDLSNQNHLTMKFGYLYPFLTIPTTPGDSFQIESAIGLKFMPLVFPVQTRIRCQVSYFYVRLKNLWKDYRDWISNHRPDAVHPFIKQDASFFKTGSLADYLGVPTTIVTNGKTSVSIPFIGAPNTSISRTRLDAQGDNSGNSAPSSVLSSRDSIVSAASNVFQLNFDIGRMAYVARYTFTEIGNGSFVEPYNDYSYNGHRYDLLHAACVLSAPIVNVLDSATLYIDLSALLALADSDSNVSVNAFIACYDTRNSAVTSFDNEPIDCIVLSNAVTIKDLEKVNACIANGGMARLCIHTGYSKAGMNVRPVFPLLPTSFTASVPASTIVEASNYETPFANGAILLNALPFRAYESIYNAFYRNTINDPFKINGVEEYNKYVTNDNGGADTTPYHLFQRNWELDQFTSALPQPQQGAAPLVGMSTLNTMQITNEDGEIVNYRVTTADDGQVIVKLSAIDPTATAGTNNIAMSIAQAGFTVNDFRNVNALQRWLETNIRKGYRYADFISGHHGVTPGYKELDMPEFLGGYSRQVEVGQVTNMAAGDSIDGSKLGEFAGTAQLFSQGEHAIHHYCDDYGYIMGIVTIYPDPVYSQVLPKDFLKSSVLDYYFPEFSNIGMQPITYEEMTPLQRFYEGKSLTDTFGYQRPNYDMIARLDECHGQFRTDLRNFLIQRLFRESPELGHDFLAVTPEDANQIFSVTDSDNAPILGQIINRVYAKRPVPRVAIPRLE